MNFNEWWKQFRKEWCKYAPENTIPPQQEFFDYFEDGNTPTEAVLETISHLQEFQPTGELQ